MAKKLLLVDANILSHALTPNQTGSYVELFKELEKEYKFVVTGYTQYELTCSSDKEHRQKINEFIRHNMVYVELSDVLMNFASRLFYLYQKHPGTKHMRIGTGDIINAAFSIAKPCCLITIDNNDHPKPFFQEVDRIRVKYKSKKNHNVTDTLYILQPDIPNTKECFTNHEV